LDSSYKKLNRVSTKKSQCLPIIIKHTMLKCLGVDFRKESSFSPNRAGHKMNFKLSPTKGGDDTISEVED